MEMDQPLNPPTSLHDQRALGKLGLETFALHYDNRFEYAATTAIGELKSQLTACFERDTAFKESRKNKPVKQAVATDLTDMISPELAAEHDNLSELFYMGEEILAYEEMKVIYAYKHFEIYVKSLMGATYPNVSTRELYKWESLMTFLKSKDILPVQLDGFKEVDQLRRVNNALKHSGEIDAETGKIAEFVGKSTFTYMDLGAFYERVKRAPAVFLQALSFAIYKDLYHFDDTRIENIVVDFVKRMEPATAAKLCERLQAHYQ